LELSESSDPVEEQSREYVSLNLYRMVAEEKAEIINEQRPAIRKLGRNKLKELVLYTLDNYLNDLKNDEDIARKFDISKATFSRFAGRDWKKSTGGSKNLIIPDLWKNVAAVITHNPLFLETAITLGIKGVIDKIVHHTDGEN
ncbi:MAG: hypothetical protein MUP82_10625, partial [Candidatus Marinimicrobia bacterium]|nr:hypothetical protein [Candidatus Neomarinimicrobiota bacterium]